MDFTTSAVEHWTGSKMSLAPSGQLSKWTAQNLLFDLQKLQLFKTMMRISYVFAN